jgi:hypothetical protein
MNVRRYFSVHDFDAKRQRVSILSWFITQKRLANQKSARRFIFISLKMAKILRGVFFTQSFSYWYTKPKVVFGFVESGLHPLIRQFQALDLLNF